MNQSVRDQSSSRHLLDALKKVAPFAQGLVLSTLPRGGLQIVQPSHVSESILKAYLRGLHADDRMSWRCILEREATRPTDCWDKTEFPESAYAREVLEPLGVRHVIALPLAAPVLEGYPGVVHLARTAEQGDFRSAEVEQLLAAVRQFDAKQESARESRRDEPCGPGVGERPPVSLAIVDGKLNARLAGAEWAGLDDRLRDQMIEQARARMHKLNGDPFVGDRVALPDSHGDLWIFRVVTYRQYPAVGDGPFTFFCLLPDCCQWGGVKPQDFQADAELARLIPSLRFMQQEYHRGPTLVEIAQTVGLSPFHFHRRFTELLGLTPKQFLLECQIHEAKSQLVARAKDLAVIAKDCGFAHQSHFTSRFKQATGLTPTRWRRMVGEREKAEVG